MGKETVQTLRVDNDKLKEKLTHISKEFKKGKRQWGNNEMAPTLKVPKVPICKPLVPLLPLGTFVELNLPRNANINFGVLYRQHNSPQWFRI